MVRRGADPDTASIRWGAGFYLRTALFLKKKCIHGEKNYPWVGAQNFQKGQESLHFSGEKHSFVFGFSF